MNEGITRLIERCRKGMHGYGRWLTLVHDLWTSVNNQSVLGASINVMDEDFNDYTISCFLVKHNSSHGATDVARVLQRLFLRVYQTNLSVETYTAGSDTTGCARNVSGNLGALQEDCELHGVALICVYSTGSKENTKMVTETDDVSGDISSFALFTSLLTFYFSTRMVTRYLSMGRQRKSEL